jgi:hypothetical protein
MPRLNGLEKGHDGTLRSNKKNKSGTKPDRKEQKKPKSYGRLHKKIEAHKCP